MSANELYVIVDSSGEVLAASTQEAAYGENMSAIMLPGPRQKMFRISDVADEILAIRDGEKFHAEVSKIFRDGISGNVTEVVVTEPQIDFIRKFREERRPRES